MSTNIDRNVVSMEFDNSNFEKNIQTSMLSLDNLRKSLTLENAANGLASSIDTISRRFSTMGIIGMTALHNITNSAINTSKRLISSLTIDPIKTGLSEYEEKINSIQTILMGAKNKDGTAVSLDQVKQKLEELNKYSDLTIYSFKDMTSNIGKFTNAGVDLDTAVKAIQGVSNVAAVSGANAQQASHAMYNFSQALSAGYVKLIDWKSIENAGMATQEFKTQLLEAGVQAGTLKKEANGMYKVLTKNGQGSEMKETINATKNFNDSLGYQWMTTEVLTSTLGKYSDSTTDIGKKAFQAATQVKTFTQLLDTLREAAQSGWAMTWEYIIGDFEEAKKLWTGVSNEIGGIIDASAKDRNELVKGWKELGGRDVLFKGIANAWKTLKMLAGDLKDAFRDVFPKTTAKQLFSITKAFEAFTSKVQGFVSLEGGKLQSTFRGFFAAIDIVKQAISAVIKVLSPLLKFIPGLSNGILGVTGSLGDVVYAIDENIKKNDIFYKALKKVRDVIVDSAPFQIFSGGLKVLSKGLSGISSIIEKVRDKISVFMLSFNDKSTEKVEKTGSVLETLANIFKVVATVLKNTGTTIRNAFVKAFENFNVENATNLINGGLLAAILVGIKNFVKDIKKTVGELGFVGQIKDTLDTVKTSIGDFQNSIKSKTLLTIASAIGILAISLVVLAGIDGKKLGTAFAGITGLFYDLITAMAMFEKFSGSGKGLAKTSAMLISMSSAILILSFAMTRLSSISWNGIAKGVVAVGALAAILTGMAKVLNTIGGKKVSKSAKGMITISIAINVLAMAVEKLGKMKAGDLTRGLEGVLVLLVELSGFLQATDFDGLGVLSGAGLLLMAFALSKLSSVVEAFAKLKVTALVRSIGAIGALLAEIAIFSKFTGKSSKMLSSSAALVIMAAGLKILSGVLITFGNMEYSQIGKGLLMLAGSLTAMVVSLKLMSGGLAGAAAVMVMAVALRTLAPVLETFASMSIIEIAKSLGVLAATFAVLGAAGYLLAPVAPVLLAIAGAVVLFGVGVTTVGVGLLAISAGLAGLAASLTALGAGVVATTKMIVTSLAGIVPLFAEVLAKGVLSFTASLLSGADQVVQAGVAFGMALLDGLKQLIPALVDTGMTLIMALLQGLRDNIAAITLFVSDVIVNFINAFSLALPRIIDAGVNMVISFIDGLALGIDQNGARLVTAFLNLFKSIGNLLLEELAAIAETIPGVGSKIADGIRKSKFELDKNLSPGDATKTAQKYAKGAVDGVKDLPEKFGETSKKSKEKFTENLNKGDTSKDTSKLKKDAVKGLSGIEDEFKKIGKNAKKNLSTEVSDTGSVKKATKSVSKSAKVTTNTASSASEGKKLGDSYASGISKSSGKVKSAGAKLAGQGVSGVKSKNKEFTSSGKSSGAGLVRGLNSSMGSMRAMGARLARAVNSSYRSTLQVRSPSRVMMWNAKMTVMGLVKGFSNNIHYVTDAAGEVASNVKDTISRPLSTIADAFSGDFSSDPVITPVVDLSNVDRGIATINKSFEHTKGLTLSPTLNARAASINGTMNAIQNGSANSDVVNAIGKLRRDISNLNGNQYNINGITYDDGTNVHTAVQTLIRAATIEGRA